MVYWTFHLGVNGISLAIVFLALMELWSRRRAFASLWPLWGPWVALVLFHAYVYAEPRYLLPARCGQIVLASCAAERLWHAFRARRARVRVVDAAR